MGKWGAGLIWVAGFVATIAARAEAQVRLTTDKPNYKVGANQPVTITLTNGGTQTIKAGPFSILQGLEVASRPHFVGKYPTDLGLYLSRYDSRPRSFG